MDKRLLTETKTARWALLLTVVLSLVTGLLVIAQAFLLSQTINQVFLRGAALEDVTELLVGLGLVITLRALAAAAESFAAAQIAIRVKTDLRRRLIQHLVALGPMYTQGERSGELVLTSTTGIDALDAWFRDYLPGLFTAVIIPITMLIFVFPLDVLTFIVLLVTAPLIPVFMVLIGKAAGIVAQQQYAVLGRLSAHFLDVLQGLTTLKLFNRSKAQIQIIRRITDQFRETTLSVLRVAFLSAFALELLATLSVALVAVEIGLRLLNGGIAFEQALFLLVIAPEYYLPLRSLGIKFHAGTEGTAAADRIFDVLATPVDTPSEVQHAPPERMNIRFEHVSFAYEHGSRPALHDVTFSIRSGEKVALVGSTGSGKTTIANMLLGFIQPYSGQITVDGLDLRGLNMDDWRKSLAWVPQSPYLFNTTITENIHIGRENATMDEIIHATKAAGLHDFIMTLPQAYKTVIGERGARLSGGQAQRVALARAFLRQSPLVILDEATSNLDPQTESDIDTALSQLLQNRTALIIAHRLNTVFKADRILVMAEGRIVEQGTHDELMAKNGVYRGLVNAYGDSTDE